MKREAFRDVLRVLTFLAIGFVGFYLFRIHNELQAVHARLEFRAMPPIRVEIDNEPLQVDVENEVQVQGSVSIDR
jgi:hypothetical protein